MLSYQPRQSGWNGKMADLGRSSDRSMRLQCPRAARPQPTVVPSSIDDTPTEPATSPRMIDPQVQRMASGASSFQHKVRLVHAEEPEKYPTRFIVNDGQWTPEEHEEELRKAAQAGKLYAWNREAREEAVRQESRVHEKHGRMESNKSKSRLQRPSIRSSWSTSESGTSSTRALPECSRSSSAE